MGETDASLVRRSATGDQRAFEALFHRHAAAVRTFLRTKVGKDETDDLLVETFASAWQSADRFRPDAASARPWIFGIAMNHVRHHFARMRHQAEIRERHEAAHEPRRSTHEPEHALEHSAVYRALMRLPASERDVLLLVSLGELRITEAAHELGVKPVAARMRLLRARRTMKTLLDDAIRGNES